MLSLFLHVYDVLSVVIKSAPSLRAITLIYAPFLLLFVAFFSHCMVPILPASTPLVPSGVNSVIYPFNMASF